MFRKKVVLDIGQYNESFSLIEDYKLVVDLLKNHHKVSNLPEFLIKYRVHKGRSSIMNSKVQQERYKLVLKEFFANFNRNFSDKDKDLLFHFLINTGFVNKDYCKDGLNERDIKKITGLSSLLLTNVTDYFKLNRSEVYFMKRIFYNMILSFIYQSPCKDKRGLRLYLFCLNKFFYLFTKPKLYLYPIKSVL